MLRQMSDVLSRLREACALVAQRAHHVGVRHDRIDCYARALGPADTEHAPAAELARAALTAEQSREARAAFWLTLDAINFGSGWFPTLRKRPGRSGYHTIEAGVRERFTSSGPWSAAELTGITTRELAATLHQYPDHELMRLFARSLGDLGRHVQAEHGGRFEALVDSAQGSATTLVEHLAGWECFADTSNYGPIELPFLKRAQIAAADLHRAGVAAFHDLDRLTMFADNLVPHVLRLDGVLEFDPVLVGRIAREELIEHGSPEEVEIRACAVHAVELIVAARSAGTAAEVDSILWNRGQQPRYKALPRHRSRCTAY